MLLRRLAVVGAKGPWCERRGRNGFLVCL